MADILDINVGGERVTVLRSTLCAVDGSMLASMFSGRWNHVTDAHGSIFLDYDPDCFKKIVKFLRFFVLDSTDPVLPMVKPDMMPAFSKLAHFFGLNHVMWPVRFAQGPNCCLTHNGTTVTRGTGGVACAMLSQGVQTGVHCWRFLNLGEDNVWFGVVRSDRVVSIRARVTGQGFFQVTSKNPTVVETTLDCETGILTVGVGCNSQKSSKTLVDFDTSVPWIPCCVLFEKDHSVKYISYKEL